MSAPSILPVILSGGAGSRLWPLSRRAHPKQLLPLVGDQTMVEATAARMNGFLPPAAICNADHADAIEAQLPDGGAVVLEPVARNTAPAAAVAALHGQAEGADLVLLSPADHHVGDPDAFRAAVLAAAPAAMDGHLVTFGITPTRPETGYGYIRRGLRAADELAGGVWRVAQFREKPDADTARAYVEAGNYLWNAGLFLFRPETLIAEMEAHVPDILQAARASYSNAKREGRRVALDREAFAASPSDSLDYAVMERTDRAAVLQVEMGWSDIGSFASLHDAVERNSDGNAGGSTLVESSGNLVRTDGPRVHLVGVEGLGVVVSGDDVLVVDLAHSQSVKQVVDSLKAKGDTDRL